MNVRRFLTPLASALCAIPLMLAATATAQEVPLGELVNKGLEAMKAGQWQEALKLNQKAVDDYGKNQPLQLFGPQFGTIYYRKGICEMQLKNYAAALQSFDTCYKDFPNGEKTGNTFHKLSLLRAGEAAIGGKDWQLALDKFKKFIKEHDKARDKYQPGTLYVSLAICSYELGKIPEGNDYLEIAIRNKSTFPTADSDIIKGFQSLVTGVVMTQNEQALIDFIAKNRGNLVIDPFEMQRYSSVFMKLAGDAIAAGMDRGALALYQFVPDTSVAIDDTTSYLKGIGSVPSVLDGGRRLIKQQLEADLENLDKSKRSDKSVAITKLAATAYLFEKNGNTRGAYTCYRMLEEFHKNAERREDNLYNLVRTTSVVAGPVATQELAELFLRTFPESKYTNLVRRMMLSAIFYSGDYDTCIEIAKPMLDLVDPGSKEHDMCLHVLGGSYFYSGRFDLAKPLLDEHVEKYPKSDFALSAAYFQAANYSRLQQFKKASGLLDKFLETYPKPSENVFMPFALYDRANCHYSLEENDKALEVLARLIKDFPASNVVDQAYNLRGNVYQTEEKPELSEKAFIAGLEIAEERQHKVVAGESLFSLIALIAADKEAGKEKQEELLAYSDKFWEKYADGSPYRSKVAVAQWPTYHANGRSEKGLKIMQQVIADIAKSPGATGLEELINSYTDSYLEDHTPEELKKHYYNFPDIHSDDYAALALLRVGVIGVFENVVRKSADAKVKRDGSAMIQVLFQELKNDFKLADLSNYILVKVGDYLRTSTSTPKEALPYYNELLGREDKEHQFSALLGRADVNGGSDNKAEIDMAIADFEVVFEKSEEKAEREFAYFRIIELLMKKGDYKEAAEKCNYYLDRNTSKFSKFSAKVGLMLAESFDKRNMVGDAIAMYVKVWSAHMGNIAISAPAMTRWMRLSWDRNNPGVDGNPSDRQGAYEGGARYLELTGRFKDKMVDSDLALWKDVEELVKTYEANPNIKSLEQIKKEKEG